MLTLCHSLGRLVPAYSARLVSDIATREILEDGSPLTQGYQRRTARQEFSEAPCSHRMSEFVAHDR